MITYDIDDMVRNIYVENMIKHYKDIIYKEVL